MVAHSSDEPVSLPRTFLFTDIEGSYRQWERHPQAMPAALAAHDAILQRAVTAQGGRIFKTIGDAVCAVFERPLDGVRAAAEAQRALHATDWSAIGLAQPLTVRMAVQSGDAVERDGDFTGLVLNRISRLLRAGHGGQVLLTRSIADELTRAGMTGVGVRDLGERRLRDVPGANRIYQLEIDGLPTTFPPLETLDAIAHNLPVALNTCLDREQELAEIRRLLLDSPARLVTLLGPGGIGKTRLALHAATQLIDAFPGGVWFVDLSGIRDAALTPTAVAAVLGARLEPGIDPQRSLTETIGDREMLLLLDNCEQIVDGAARFIAGLLPNAPGLRILATSRIPLDLRGEQRIDIGPLPIEKNDDAGPAVQLFVERAQQIRPAFEMTAANQDSVYEICRRVDGIPLALELAAARVAVLSPEALRTRLSSRLALLTSTSRDLPERHQTLRGAIEWSYALLSPEEQVAFRALSVFQGGWSLAGAQAVTGLDEVATMEVLASLCDKSLVRLTETDDGQPRYSMLETIQEYGYELLSRLHEGEDVRSAHGAFYSSLVEEAASHLEGGPDQRFWLAALDRELLNLRSAMRWSLETGRFETALDFCINSWIYWSQFGRAAEGQQWFQEALSMAGATDPSLKARALRQFGHLCIERGELGTAERLYRASLEIEQTSGSLSGIANSLANLGMVLGMLGRMPDEEHTQREALAAFRKIGDVSGVAHSLFNLAHCARNQGRTHDASRLLEEVSDLQIELQDAVGIAYKHTLSAQLHLDLGELDDAVSYLDAAEQIFTNEEVEDGLNLVWLLRASVEQAHGHASRAESLIEQAASSYESRGDNALLARTLELRASLCADRGDGRQGAQYLGTAIRLREVTSAAIPPVDTQELIRVRRSLETLLGTHAFMIELEKGKFSAANNNRLKVGDLDMLGLIGFSTDC